MSIADDLRAAIERRLLTVPRYVGPVPVDRHVTVERCADGWLVRMPDREGAWVVVLGDDRIAAEGIDGAASQAGDVIVCCARFGDGCQHGIRAAWSVAP